MSASQLIFGCGYLGERVARLWQQKGDEIYAVTRSRQRGDEFHRTGLSAVIADVTQGATLGSLPATDAVLFAVGYDRNADADIYAVYAGGLQNVLAALPQSVSRVIYISTTGVYGTAGGEWVNEESPTEPQREGGKASLAAEQVLAAHPVGKQSAILRLAGIYGPGRIPYLDKLRAGEPLAVPSAGWLNLIHVDDAARIVVAADRWLAGRAAADGPHVFCVSDGSPVRRGDYYAEVARRIGAAAPTFTTPLADSPAAARAAADRRVSNAKLLREIGLTLQYPNYRRGLAAILGDA